MPKIILCRGIQGSGKTTWANLEFKDFFIPLQKCIERDSKRPNPIGEEVIRKTYERYKDILKV